MPLMTIVNHCLMDDQCSNLVHKLLEELVYNRGANTTRGKSCTPRKDPAGCFQKKNLLNKVKDREHQRAFYCDFSSLVN